jgi:hypothetical protein
MIFIGILVTLLGFILSVASVAISSSTGVRLVVVLIGIAVSLFGIMRILNPVYLKTAIWRKS